MLAFSAARAFIGLSLIRLYSTLSSPIVNQPSPNLRAQQMAGAAPRPPRKTPPRTALIAQAASRLPRSIPPCRRRFLAAAFPARRAGGPAALFAATISRARRRRLRTSCASARPACRRSASRSPGRSRRASSRRSACSEIVNDDMPFLVDSVMGELTERGLDVRAGRASGVRRRARRRRQRSIALNAAPGQPARRESFIHIHLAPIDDDAAARRDRARHRAGARRTCGSRCRTGGRCSAASARSSPSSRPIRRRCRSTRSPRRSSSWNGCSPTISPSSACATTCSTDNALEPVPRARSACCARRTCACSAAASELLEYTPEIMAFLKEPKPLIVTKANVRSRVHRRVYLDYIGVKRFDAGGQARRRVPHRRPVHLDRLYALGAHHSLSAPQGRRRRAARRLRPEQPFRQGAGQRAGALSARRAVPDRRGHALPISRSRSCSSTSGRACACWRGATASTASSRCSSIVPRDRYDSRIARAIGDYLAERLRRPRLGLLSVLPGRAAGARPLHHRPRTAARRRRSTAPRWKKAVGDDHPHLDRRSRRRARRCVYRAGQGRDAVRALSATPSPPATAKPIRRRSRSTDIRTDRRPVAGAAARRRFPSPRRTTSSARSA